MGARYRVNGQRELRRPRRDHAPASRHGPRAADWPAGHGPRAPAAPSTRRPSWPVGSPSTRRPSWPVGSPSTRRATAAPAGQHAATQAPIVARPSTTRPDWPAGHTGARYVARRQSVARGGPRRRPLASSGPHRRPSAQSGRATGARCGRPWRGRCRRRAPMWFGQIAAASPTAAPSFSTHAVVPRTDF